MWTDSYIKSGFFLSNLKMKVYFSNMNGTGDPEISEIFKV